VPFGGAKHAAQDGALFFLFFIFVANRCACAVRVVSRADHQIVCEWWHCDATCIPRPEWSRWLGGVAATRRAHFALFFVRARSLFCALWPPFAASLSVHRVPSSRCRWSNSSRTTTWRAFHVDASDQTCWVAVGERGVHTGLSTPHRPRSW